MATKRTDLRAFTDNATHTLSHGLSNGVPTAIIIDQHGGAITFISQEHHMIHEGRSFRYEDSVTLGSAVSQDYLLTVPSGDYPHFTFSADGSAITQVQVFEDTDKTGTTLQTTFNANRNSATASVMTVHKSVTGGTTDGTRIATYSSGSASNQSKSSSIAEFNKEFILKTNTKYIIRITSGTAGNLCNISMNWYE